MKKIVIETLGCRLNQIESESAARFFLDKDFQVIMDSTSAKTAQDDSIILCIINTCTVTQKAEQKGRRIIRLCLNKYPNAVIIVTGCYAQVSKQEIESIDKRIWVLPGQIKSRLKAVPQILKDFLKTDWDYIKFVDLLSKEILNVPQLKPGYPENSFEMSTSSFLNHSRPSLKIQDGCNNLCSYCAIHFARGKSVSIDVETAIKRVQELENLDYDEVVITTVNIGQYRAVYNDEVYNFTKLLNCLLNKTSKINFRISSLYPEVVDEEFCKVISNKRIRPHFHISVQSGSNNILNAMNRNYKAEQVIEACKKLKLAKQNPFIACDIITGFPGETQKDFEQTLNLCKECNFSWIHAFPFSERPGTPAFYMKNKVPQSISGERAKILTDWAIQQKISYINSYLGKELTAIVETSRNTSKCKNSLENKIYHAMTENFIHCEIITDKPLEMNKQLKVIITSVLNERIVKGGEIEAQAIVSE